MAAAITSDSGGQTKELSHGDSCPAQLLKILWYLLAFTLFLEKQFRPRRLVLGDALDSLPQLKAPQ
jgi:hypothetical protein